MAAKKPAPKKAAKAEKAEKPAKKAAAKEPKAEKAEEPEIAPPPAPTPEPAKAEAAADAPPPRKRGGGRAKAPAATATSALSCSEVAKAGDDAGLGALVEKDGGNVLARYREPFGGHSVLLVALPIEKVEPTPFQRDTSPAHVKKLAISIQKVGRFLDPILAVRQDGKYWAPNGGHRLAALKEAGATSVVALLIPEVKVAHKILALNTEKAHNLKEKALEVWRLQKLLSAVGDLRKETELDVELEEGGLVTLGAAFEKRARLSGGGYNSILKRIDSLTEKTCAESLPRREKLAAKILEADDLINKLIERIKARGIKSPALRGFLVARLNPVGKFVDETIPPPGSTEEGLDRLVENAKKFDPESVKESDLAGMGGPPPEDGEGGEE